MIFFCHCNFCIYTFAIVSSVYFASDAASVSSLPCSGDWKCLCVEKNTAMFTIILIYEKWFAVRMEPIWGTDPVRGPVIADLLSRSYGYFIFPLVGPPTVISFSWQRAPHLMCVLMIGHADRLVCCHRYIIASLSLCMENHVPQTPWQHQQA